MLLPFEQLQLTPADPIPANFAGVAERSVALAGILHSEWAEALVTQYAVGSGISLHRDAPAFGVVAGISLQRTCRMRFPTGTGPNRITSAIQLPARSIYLLAGEARTKWQHMIPPVKEERFSITFRTLRKRGRRRSVRAHRRLRHQPGQPRPAGIVRIKARSTAFTAFPVSKTRATSGSRTTAMDSGPMRFANRFALAFT